MASIVSKRLLHYHRRVNYLLLDSMSRRYGLVSRHWDDEYGVRLDQRHLRTPLRKVFSVPTESLATAVAQEWRTQDHIIQPALMHLTALCNTAIDNPLGKTQDQVVSQAIQYLSSDTVCFRMENDESLTEAQNREWNPVIDWFNERFNGDLTPTTSLLYESSTSDELCDTLTHYIKDLNIWSLTGFSHALDSTSSVVLTCALMEGRIDPLEASSLAQLEMKHQVAKWGSVEWQHEVESNDLLSRLSACVLLSRLSGISKRQINDVKY